MLVLPQSFYNRDTLLVARQLIGKVFIRKLRRNILSGRIIETEAYSAENDPACHGNNGITERNRIMFGPPGFAYVYFTYGMHYCLNFVTEPKDTAATVLIRAVEPLNGIKYMKENRGTDNTVDLCSGPAKLTQAFAIDRTLNGCSLLGGCLSVVDDGFSGFGIGVSQRIGIKVGVELPWRFFIRGSRFLSRKEN